jgi:hypothetical protein
MLQAFSAEFQLEKITMLKHMRAAERFPTGWPLIQGTKITYRQLEKMVTVHQALVDMGFGRETRWRCSFRKFRSCDREPCVFRAGAVTA